MFIIKVIYVYLFINNAQSLLEESSNEYDEYDDIEESSENNVISKENTNLLNSTENERKNGNLNSTIETGVCKHQAIREPEESNEYTNDYSYIASIQRQGSHYANGALVDKRWVLSCASEFYNVRESIKLFRVRLGSVNCKRDGNVFPIKVVHVHPSFVPGKPNFDIALLRLAVPATSTFVFRPIKLSEEKGKVVSAKFMTNYWPRIVVKGRVLPLSAKERTKFTHMRVSTQKLIPSPECAKRVQQLDDSSLCLKPLVTYHSICSPDVGAPVVGEDGLWGITSGWVSPTCPLKPGPTLFTRVSSTIVRSWMNIHLRRLLPMLAPGHVIMTISMLFMLLVGDRKRSQVVEEDQHTKLTFVQQQRDSIANTTLLTYGLQSGWISPMTKVLQADESPLDSPLSDSELSWIASTMCLSAVFGVSMYTYIADTYGRRMGIIAIAIPQALSWILKLSTTSTTGLVLARICCGIPAGGCFNIIPMYIKEISQDKIRGLLGSIMILMQNIGILTMYAMGSYLEYHTVLWIVVGIPLLTAVLMLKAPESPAFLVNVGKTDEAAKTIAFLRGLEVSDKSIHNEISYMTTDDFYYKSLPKISYFTILKNKPWRRAFLLSIAMITVSTFNGNYAILTYAAAILQSSGVTFSPELQALSFPAVMILGSFLSMGCVEKVGRRIILSTSFIVTVVALVCLASTQLALDHGMAPPRWLPLISIVLSLCAYSAGVSPIPYIMMSEMFNFQIRAKVMGFIVTYAWLISFVQLSLYSWACTTFGAHAAFYGFAAVNLLGVMVAWYLPETRGKTVHEIEVALAQK